MTAISKRTFLGLLGTVPVGIAVFKEVLSGGFISPAYAAEAPAAPGSFTLPKLPYAVDALERVIDAQTMTLHHDKHHQAYVDKLNAEVEKDETLKDKTIREIITNISQYNPAVRNNGGGHWNHSFFWKAMTPDKTEPSELFAEALKKSFGSQDEFQKQFEDAGAKQFGSGWVWLIVNDKGLLEVTSTPNQDNPLMDDAEVKGTPILGNDVWEHAYYLRYFNKRPDYLKAWWSVVNWTRVSELYALAKK